MGPEQSVHTFFDWMVRLVRSRPQKTDQMAQFWMATSWKLALDMRAGKSFSESTCLLMKDYDSFSECMSREPTQVTKKSTPATPAPKGELKGSGKGNTKSGKTARAAPYTKGNRSWGSSTYDRQEKGSHPWQNSQKSEDKQHWGKDSWSSDWRAPQK